MSNLEKKYYPTSGIRKSEMKPEDKSNYQQAGWWPSNHEEKTPPEQFYKSKNSEQTGETSKTYKKRKKRSTMPVIKE